MQSIDRKVLFVAFTMLLCGLIVAAPDLWDLCVVLAIPLVFYIPGHMILRLFRCYSALGLEGALYAFGISLAAVMAGGFLLNWIGLMTPLSWAILLCSVAAIGWAVPIRQRSDLVKRHVTWPVTGLQALMFSCAAIISVGAFIVDRREALAHAEFKYTEFWMFSQDPGNPNSLTLGIENSEGKPASYEVEYMIGGQMAGKFPAISLEPGESWTSALNTGFEAGHVTRVEAWLFKDGDYGTVYRRVWADIGHS